MDRLNGMARLQIADGRVTDLHQLVEQQKIFKVIFIPFLTLQKLDRLGVLRVKFPDFVNVSFREVRGDYLFQQGVMDIQNFYLDSPEVWIASKGKVDLPKEELDLHVTTKLQKGKSMGDLAEYLVDKEGRPTLGFFIKGPFSKPSVKPDIAAAKQKAAEEVIQKGVEKGLKFLDQILKKKEQQ